MNFRKASIIGILSMFILFIYGVYNGMAAEKAPYVIGGIVSTTGPYAHWGTQLADGEAFTVKQWNERGGIKGFPIKYVASDDECKPDRALIITKMLVTKENVLAIVAGGLTASVTAMSPYLNEGGVPFIFSAGGKTYDLSKEKFMFGVLPNTPIVIDYKLRWLKNKGITKVALVADNTAYGEENAVYTPGAVKRAGMELAELARFSLSDMDMTPMLARVKAKNPGAIILAAGGDDAVRNIKQMKQVGLNVPILCPVAVVDNIFVRNLGDEGMGQTNVYADGNYLMSLDQLPDTDRRKVKSRAFVQAFEKEYGKKFNYGNGVGADKVETILRAIRAVAPEADKIDYKNAGKLKKIREDIRNWIENAKGLDLLLGTYSRSAEDHIGVKDTGMVRLVDGKWILAD
jgi:branched-chain amino acid transport system substrate-binding protein